MFKLFKDSEAEVEWQLMFVTWIEYIYVMCSCRQQKASTDE